MRSESIHDKGAIDPGHSGKLCNDNEEIVMTREETRKIIEEYFKDYSTGDF